MKKFDRQILAIGATGQKNIQQSKVLIVGLGGTGSHISQSLAYLGVGSFILIDDDCVEETNLNRLIGGSNNLIGQRKVDVAASLINLINEDANIVKIFNNLFSREAFEEIIKAEYVFGCVDNDSSRLVLNELCCAYSIPLIDSATEIIPHDDYLDFGGRVIVCPPGEYCLLCADQIDTERAKQELEGPEARTVKEMHGYGLSEKNPAPAVVSLNGVVANLATTEFMFMVSGVRKPNLHLTYHATRGNVNIRTNGKISGCYYCESVAGTASRANVFRYL